MKTWWWWSFSTAWASGDSSGKILHSPHCTLPHPPPNQSEGARYSALARSALKGIFARFPRKAPKPFPHWALLIFSIPSRIGPFASELLQVLFLLPGMPILPDELLCILQGPTQMSPPLKCPLFFTCAVPAHHTPLWRQPIAALRDLRIRHGRKGRKEHTRGRCLVRFSG